MQCCGSISEYVSDPILDVPFVPSLLPIAISIKLRSTMLFVFVAIGSDWFFLSQKVESMSLIIRGFSPHEVHCLYFTFGSDVDKMQLHLSKHL